MRGSSGLTLIEVLVATAVFGLVVFALSGFYLTASSRAHLGRAETAAALLAQQRIELARTTRYNDLPGLGGSETIDELGSASAAGPFTRATAVTTPYLGSLQLTEVAVTVTWVEVDVPRTLTFTTVVEDR